MELEIQDRPVRYYEIDCLRFMAAISVVLYHYTYRGYHAEHASPIDYPHVGAIFKYGYLGVELFFIISGYVILLSAQGKTVGQFFASRVVRLYPAYWVACTLTFVLVRVFAPAAQSGIWSPAKHATMAGYLYSLTMLQGFFGVPDLDGVYWTLTIEIGFYFLIALLIAFGWLNRHLLFLIAGWMMYCAWVGPSVAANPFALLLFPRYAPFFAAGMGFYLLQTKRVPLIKLYPLLIACYVLSMRSSRAITNDMVPFFKQPFSLLIVGVVTTMFFAIFILIIKDKIRLRHAQWLTMAGAVSYPLYLVHNNIGFVILQRLGGKVEKHLLLGMLLTAVIIMGYTIVRIEHRYAQVLRKNLKKWIARH